ncbi:MAG: hypothetical protein JXA82_14495 [Sedimentisphaerales bacterium]|nr:hypothetical protein [Sedimentisphaerales bacterium]
MVHSKKSRTKRVAQILAVWLTGVVCLTTLVIGQVNPPVMPAATAGRAATASDTEPAVEGITTDTMGQAIQTITFKKDMTINDALRFLAMKYQKNIVPTSRVEGMVTVTNLYDVSFEEALQAVIGTNKYEIQGNFIRVYTPEEFEQVKADKRRMEYRFFNLYYLTAEEAKKMVTAILSQDGSVATSSPAKTGVPTGDSISSDASGGDNLATTDTIVVRDYPEKLIEVEDLLNTLDVRPQQVLIEATILSATLTEDFEMGFDLNFAAGASITKTTAAGWANGGQAGSPIDIGGFAGTGQTGLKIGVTAGDISMFITALETLTDVTILANPKILAINKQLGQVYIGTKLGYREGDVITDGGATQQGAVKFLDTGTKLSFRPYIGNDGYIRMDIHPKDSTGSLNAQGVPDEISAELLTNIVVRDGETIVIGGMFRDQIDNTRTQVPLLGDIPFIGEAFRKTDDIVKRQEVMVLLTPHIINEPHEVDGHLRAEDVKRKRWGTYERLNWITTARMAENSYARAAEFFSNGDSHSALEELNWALHLRPTYLEAIRLRERIVQYRGSAGDDVIERIMIDAIQKEDTKKWNRF